MTQTMDKSQFQQIQNLIAQNPIITGFDVYYLGFFSRFVPQLTLHDIFVHVGNIINLHNDGLINSQEKIDFFIRMLSKKLDQSILGILIPNHVAIETQAASFLNEYFIQILKIIPRYANVGKFELFYLGRFHAICPSHKIAELFHHVNNINALVAEDLIDEATQIDFLLRILNKKIVGNTADETGLNIPGSSSGKSSENRVENHEHQRSKSSDRKDQQPGNGEFSASNTSAFMTLTPKNNNKSYVPKDFSEEKSDTREEAFKPYKNKMIAMDTGRNRYIEPQGSAKDFSKDDLQRENRFMQSKNNRQDREAPNKPQNIQLKRMESGQFSFQNSIASGESQTLVRKDPMNFEFRGSNQNVRDQEVSVHEEMDEENNLNALRQEEKQIEVENDEDMISEKDSQNIDIEDGGEHADQTDQGEASKFGRDLKEKNLENKNPFGYRVSINIEKQNGGMAQSEENAYQGESRENSTNFYNSQEYEQKANGKFLNREPNVTPAINLEDKSVNKEKSFNDEEAIDEEDHEEVFEGNAEGDMEDQDKNLENENAVQGSNAISHSHSDQPENSLVTDEGSKQNRTEQISNVEKIKEVTFDNNEETLESQAQEHSKPIERTNENDNQSEVDRLKAQLYPEKQKDRGTLDDILNSLLDSNETRSEANKSQYDSRLNSVQPSFDPQGEYNVPKDKHNASLESSSSFNLPITAGQVQDSTFPTPRNINREHNQFQSSIDIEKEVTNEQNVQGQVQAGQEVQSSLEQSEIEFYNKPADKETPENTGQSDVEEIYPHPAKAGQSNSKQKYSMTDSQASQPDLSFILKLKATSKGDENNQGEEQSNYRKDLMLQQVVNQIQPSLLEDPIIKVEESESRVIIEANTQFDPTLEDGQDYSYVQITSFKRSPMGKELDQIEEPNEQVDGSLRICETIKQSLSQPLQVHEIESSLPEVLTKDQNAEIKVSQSEDRSQWSQSRKDAFNELYGIQLSKMSSLVSKLNTLEEERLSREFLELLHKERNDSKKKLPEEIDEEKEIKLITEPQVEQMDLEEKDKRPDHLLEENTEEKNKQMQGSGDLEANARREDAHTEMEGNYENNQHEEHELKHGERSPVIPEEEKTTSNKVMFRIDSKESIEKTEKNKPTEIIEEVVEEAKADGNLNVLKRSSQESIDDSTKCSLCRESLALKTLGKIETCEHIFHQECVNEYLNQKVDEKSYHIRCPKKNCENVFRLPDLMDYLDIKRQEKYVISSLKNYIESHEEISCCPTPGCPFAFLKTSYSPHFSCTLCRKSYCMSCHVEWHQNVTCNEYKMSHKREEEDNNYFSNIKSEKLKQCTDCKLWVLKKPSSDLMKCRCGSSFCYCCGTSSKNEECDCKEKDSTIHPIVQPDLFHRAMQAPGEYKAFADSRAGDPLKGRQNGVHFKKSGLNSAGHTYRPTDQKPDGSNKAAIGMTSPQSEKDKKFQRDHERDEGEKRNREEKRNLEKGRRRRDNDRSRSRSRSNEKEKRF